MSTHTLRRRFVRDQALPIQLIQSPYFDYYIELYDKQFGSSTSYKAFLKEAATFENGEDFLASYHRLKDAIIGHVKGKEAFQTFNDDRMEKFQIQKRLPKSKLYDGEHHGERFISIDLEKANFHALKYYDAAIVDGKETYEEWFRQFSDSNYLASSKYLRQVLFGNLNPKKQQTIQQYVTHSFLHTLTEYVEEHDIVSASHDEIILKNTEGLSSERLKEVLERQTDGAFPLHVDAFHLHVQEPQKQFGFVKEYENGGIEFKGVPSIFFAQAYKRYYDMPFVANDLLFYHEGEVARFLEPVKTKP